MRKEFSPEERAEYRRLLVNYIGVNAALVSFAALFLFLAYRGVISAGGCPCVRLFHFYCPACGGTRATMALIEGRLLASLRYNPAIFVGALVTAYLEVSYGLALLTGNLRLARATRTELILLFPIALCLVFFVRNGLLLAGKDTLGDVHALIGKTPHS